MIGPILLFTFCLVLWTGFLVAILIWMADDIRAGRFEFGWVFPAIMTVLFVAGVEFLVLIPEYADYVFGTQWTDYIWERKLWE